MLIIKSEIDEDVELLLKQIEQIPKLTEIVEITYNLENLQKVIVIGFPKISTPEKILQQIKQKFQEKKI